MNFWLLQQDVLDCMESARASGIQASAAQIEEFQARKLDSRVTGKTAVIAVDGVLTPKPDLYAYLFGGGNTAYPEIINALAEADADASVESIEMHFSSPGGNVMGLFETIDAMQATKKPIRAVGSLAASAAYALFASADESVAASRGSVFGSIGVKTQRFVDKRLVTITSTDAPNKAPDASTEEGLEAIRAELDEVHAMFAEAIAEGRGVTAKKVNSSYGGGHTFLAQEALNRGMIDGIVSAKPTPANERGKTKKAKSMDLETLRAEHPATFKAAVELGINQERERVKTFAVAGRMSGETAKALEACENGAEMTASLQMEYLMAATNRNHQNAHLQDVNDAAAAAAAASAPSQEEQDALASAELTNQFLELCGVAPAGGVQ